MNNMNLEVIEKIVITHTDDQKPKSMRQIYAAPCLFLLEETEIQGGSISPVAENDGGLWMS